MPRFDPNPVRRPAVVTGASSGIGQATAVALASLGHPVVLGARRVDECEQAAAAIRDEGGEAVAIHLDLADGDSVERFALAAVDALGDVEILVSNAAQNRGRIRARHQPRRRSTGCWRSTSAAPIAWSGPWHRA